MFLLFFATNFPLFFSLLIPFQVRWFQQQHEKVRKKRDYASDLYNYRKYGILRSIAPQSRIQYRQVGEPLFFPDPLFKDQWYLVSIFNVCHFHYHFILSVSFLFSLSHSFSSLTKRKEQKEKPFSLFSFSRRSFSARTVIICVFLLLSFLFLRESVLVFLFCVTSPSDTELYPILNLQFAYHFFLSFPHFASPPLSYASLILFSLSFDLVFFPKRTIYSSHFASWMYKLLCKYVCICAYSTNSVEHFKCNFVFSAFFSRIQLAKSKTFTNELSELLLLYMSRARGVILSICLSHHGCYSPAFDVIPPIKLILRFEEKLTKTIAADCSSILICIYGNTLHHKLLFAKAANYELFTTKIDEK